MKYSTSCLVLVLGAASAVLAGCATTVPAPVREGSAPPSSLPRPPVASAPAVGGPEFHVVRPGDTLMGISRQYGLNVRDLVAWNELIDPNQLRVGQQIRVAPPGGVSVQPVAIGQPVEITPVLPPGGELAGTPVKQEPKGGRQPYSDQAWAALRPPELPSGVPTAPVGPVVTSEWLWPASGQVIGTFNEATNKGLDISGKPGDPVIASAAGKVVYSGSGLRGYGKLVIIKHDANYLTAYAHNQELLVKEGDSVEKGQKIAELGSTDADRPKLHFEIRKQGRPVDPMKYLPAR